MDNKQELWKYFFSCHLINGEVVLFTKRKLNFVFYEYIEWQFLKKNQSQNLLKSSQGKKDNEILKNGQGAICFWNK